MDNEWVLDGPIEEQIAAFEALLKDVTMIITDEQKKLAEEVVPNVQWYIDEVEVDRLLDALKEKIDEIGYDAGHQLNEMGEKLTKLCRELDEQN